MIDLLISLSLGGWTRLEGALIFAPVGAIMGIVAHLISATIRKVTGKEVSFLVIMLPLIIIAVQFPSLVRPWLEEEYPEKVSLWTNKTVAANINKGLPVKLDEATTLSYVEATSSGLSYVYNIDTENYEVDFTALQEEVLLSACTAPELIELINMDIGLSYVYRDLNNSLLTSYSADRKSCAIYAE